MPFGRHKAAPNPEFLLFHFNYHLVYLIESYFSRKNKKLLKFFSGEEPSFNSKYVCFELNDCLSKLHAYSLVQCTCNAMNNVYDEFLIFIHMKFPDVRAISFVLRKKPHFSFHSSLIHTHLLISF